MELSLLFLPSLTGWTQTPRPKHEAAEWGRLSNSTNAATGKSEKVVLMLGGTLGPCRRKITGNKPKKIPEKKQSSCSQALWNVLWRTLEGSPRAGVRASSQRRQGWVSTSFLGWGGPHTWSTQIKHFPGFEQIPISLIPAGASRCGGQSRKHWGGMEGLLFYKAPIPGCQGAKPVTMPRVSALFIHFGSPVNKVYLQKTSHEKDKGIQRRSNDLSTHHFRCF